MSLARDTRVERDAFRSVTVGLHCVMPVLDTGIHAVPLCWTCQDDGEHWRGRLMGHRVDARIKSGHDGECCISWEKSAWQQQG